MLRWRLFGQPVLDTVEGLGWHLGVSVRYWLSLKSIGRVSNRLLMLVTAASRHQDSERNKVEEFGQDV